MSTCKRMYESCSWWKFWDINGASSTETRMYVQSKFSIIIILSKLNPVLRHMCKSDTCTCIVCAYMTALDIDLCSLWSIVDHVCIIIGSYWYCSPVLSLLPQIQLLTPSFSTLHSSTSWSLRYCAMIGLSYPPSCPSPLSSPPCSRSELCIHVHVHVPV